MTIYLLYPKSFFLFFTNPNSVNMIKKKRHQCVKTVVTKFFYALFILVLTGYASHLYANETFVSEQNNKVSIHLDKKSIASGLKEIEDNSNYIFIYNEDVRASLSLPVNISIKNKDIVQTLDNLLKDTDVSYRISDRQITLYKTNKDILEQDKIIITGNVTDITGEPLIGANILIKGTTQGAITDINGNYSIALTDKHAVLVFSYIGYIQKEEPIQGRKVINVILIEDQGQLEEVVVVGYGTQKKASVVGSISTIEPAKLNVGTTRSLSNNLAGNLGGVIATQRSGEPGYDNSEFWIRGISTFGANKSPLVLVDGIERSLDNIDVQEIESMSILKDASASAVYGVRGANGVVLITTKRGKAGKTSVNVRVEHAITQPVKLPDFLGAAEYMTLLNQIAKQDNVPELFEQSRIDNTIQKVDPDLYPDVDWVDAITKDQADNTRVTLDISGGNEKLRYSFIGAYYNENGILERDKNQEWDSSLRLNRFNMRSNVDMNLTNTTLVRFNIGGYLQKRVTPPQNITDRFGDAFNTPPFVHPTIYSSGEIPRVPERVNPWADITQTGYERRTRSKLESLFSVDQDLKMILPGLKVRAVFSFDFFTENGVKRHKSPDYYNVAKGRDPETGELDLTISSYGQAFLGHEKLQEWGDNSTYLEGNITYNNTFNEKHTVDALLLYSQRDYDKGETLPYRNQGFAGRLSYTFAGRYIIEANFGYNGSENFAKGKRFGFFPSIAGGWIMSEESFMKPYINTFNKIKLRASYGLVGNDQFPNSRRFAYLTTIHDGGGDGGYKWGYLADYSRSGRWEGEMGVPNLTWETVAKTNVGIELGLWSMLDLQFDVFKERRTNIFMQRKNFPASSGFASFPWANFGKVNNQGFEVIMDVNKRIDKDWFISARGTLTYAKNKIIEQDEPLGIKGTHRSTTNYPVDQITGLLDDGLFTEDDFIDVEKGILKDDIPLHQFTDKVRPGDIKYIDVDGDNVITEKDRVPIGGTVNPELVYGFGLNLNYKSIDFGIFFQGNGKTYRMLGGATGFLPGSNQGATGNIYSNAYDSWTVENPSQDVFYPRLQLGANANNTQPSTWWLKDMSLLRLKNLELGYSLNQKWTQNAGIQFARIYLRGTNLLTFSKFKLWDPELDTKDATGLKYPLMKSYSIGLEVTF